jgi:hypothetical protein
MRFLESLISSAQDIASSDRRALDDWTKCVDKNSSLQHSLKHYSLRNVLKGDQNRDRQVSSLSLHPASPEASKQTGTPDEGNDECHWKSILDEYCETDIFLSPQIRFIHESLK